MARLVATDLNRLDQRRSPYLACQRALLGRLPTVCQIYSAVTRPSAKGGQERQSSRGFKLRGTIVAATQHATENLDITESRPCIKTRRQSGNGQPTHPRLTA